MSATNPADPDRYPCPCCGHLVFTTPPGSYALCPICWWEDDNIQLRWPDYRGGANGPSLIEAQRTYKEAGVSDKRLRAHVRPPTKDEPVEPRWRPADMAADGFEPNGVPEDPWPDDFTQLYWWRPAYWRRRPAATHAAGKVWADAATELEHAADFLENIDSQRRTAALDWLSLNELELALDELAGLGFDPGNDFWLRLDRAARSMALEESDPICGGSVRVVNQNIRRIHQREVPS